MNSLQNDRPSRLTRSQIAPPQATSARGLASYSRGTDCLPRQIPLRVCHARSRDVHARFAVIACDVRSMLAMFSRNVRSQCSLAMFARNVRCDSLRWVVVGPAPTILRGGQAKQVETRGVATTWPGCTWRGHATSKHARMVGEISEIFPV
jgi:hypothetical protein